MSENTKNFLAGFVFGWLVPITALVTVLIVRGR